MVMGQQRGHHGATGDGCLPPTGCGKRAARLLPRGMNGLLARLRGAPVIRPLILALFIACLSLPPRKAAADDPPKKTPAPRTDLYGDPLPAGVVARLGT